MPAHKIPPCPDNWEDCDHCGAAPEEPCRQPDYESNGRLMTQHTVSTPTFSHVRECPNGRGTCGIRECLGGCTLQPQPTQAHYLPQDDATRKAMPMARGLLDYFPAALAAVAAHSYAANLKHNPGEDIHWARGKSMDHADCILRHLVERGQTETVRLPCGTVVKLRASAALAWRSLALLQQELEDEGAAPGRAARFPA